MDRGAIILTGRNGRSNITPSTHTWHPRPTRRTSGSKSRRPSTQPSLAMCGAWSVAASCLRARTCTPMRLVRTHAMPLAGILSRCHSCHSDRLAPSTQCLEDEVWTTAAARCSRRPRSPSSSPCAPRFKPRSSSSTPAPKGEAGATDAPGEQQPTLASPGAVRGASRRALSCLDAGPEQSAGAELLAARAKKASASDRLRSLVAEQSRASG